MRYLWLPLSLILFLFVLGILLWSKIHTYANSPSALIGIWDGFAEINPRIVEPGFIVFTEGGYDGQFFYFIAKSLFSDLDWDVIVDSYFFRLHRIGFTLLVGIPSAMIGFKFYPIIAIILPFLIFLISVYYFYKMLPDSKKWYCLFYLFSPFSMNSHLLLVADGVFTSVVVLLIYSIKNRSHWAISFLLLTFAIFTRELGIIVAFPLLLACYKEHNYRLTFLFFIPFVLFVSFWLWTRSHLPPHLGTNPLGFKDMVDLPLLGFYKSFFDLGTFHLSPKESVKILLFFQWLVLSLFLISKITKERFRLITELDKMQNEFILLFPIFASLGIILIAEEGYWRSFDNLSRMFTLILPLGVLYNAKKESVFLSLFRYTSLILFLFFIVRIVFITKSKGFYISP